jgi:hypothetical protein
LLRGAACNASIARLVYVLVVASVEHQVLQPGGFDIGVGAMLSNQQVGGSPNFQIGDYTLQP